ncbi:MAG: glycosyltransferase family 1 protein [Terriglobia bacterium]|jgi:glycosyltransferase involved in cell wall biosynthesis
MSTIALDATYSVDPEPSGIAVYSRKLIEALAGLETPHRFLLCYRLSRFSRRQDFLRPAPRAGSPESQFSVRYYQEPLTFWLPWQADLFHSLAQRPPAFRFKREMVTVFDIFPITGLDYSTADFRRKFSVLLREAVDRAACVITASHYTAGQLLAHTSVSQNQLRVIPLGVDLPASTLSPDERQRARAGLVGEGKQLILSVGVIQTRKNTLNALRALETLPEPYRLILAGGDGHGSEIVHDYIRRQGLGSRVQVRGYVTPQELRILYQAASVMLFPSLEEGFGLPVLEAMANGLPVVASQTASLPEVGGDAALYVDPHDPRDIAEKVRRAVEDSELREKMIQQGLARAREFSWQRVAEATLQVYNEVLAT